jgi:uncharacterized damage-inducible protein DinB
MQPDQIKAVIDVLLPSIEQEFRTTRKVIAAIPAEKSSYAPHPSSRSALSLAWHLASSDPWFLNGIASGRFEWDGSEPTAVPEGIGTPADVLAYYDAEFPKAVARVRAMSAEDLAKPVDFFGVANLPVGLYLTWALSHAIHHRGQLTTYLRPMGARVPNIYGGSLDEPMTAAAGDGA